MYSNSDLVDECGSSNSDNTVEYIVLLFDTESWREVVVLDREKYSIIEWEYFQC